LLDRLINHLVSAAQSIGSRRVVLLIDELQELPPDMYPVLMSIVSGLQTYGLVPCGISMAQPEIQERIQDLHDQAKLQVIGRFFSQVKRFDALTIDEAIETIRNIDAPDAAFTAKWFPHLRDIGWSLDRLGPPLHASIDELRAQKGLAQQVLIPFNHLRPALKFMFRMLANVPECQEGLTKEHVLECLERTGYPRSCTTTSRRRTSNELPGTNQSRLAYLEPAHARHERSALCTASSIATTSCRSPLRSRSSRHSRGLCGCRSFT
jgi:hypothetical protein